MLISLTRTTASAGLRFDLARSVSSSAVLLAKKGDPTLPKPPKKAPSPYSLFFKDYYGREKDAHVVDGKINVASIARAAGAAWTALGEGDKAAYGDAARRAKAEADKAYKAFYDGLAPDTRRALEAKAGKKLSPPGGKKAAAQVLKDTLGNPGRPLTAYFAYAKNVRDDVARQVESEGFKGSSTVIEIAKRTAERWKHVAESEKETFKAEYKEAKQKYDEWLKGQGL
ncbi:hypothetical protein Q5752_003713 [Cryptotrichosporon argae]